MILGGRVARGVGNIVVCNERLHSRAYDLTLHLGLSDH